MIDQEQLKGIAAQCLNLMRLDIERRGDFGLFIATWDAASKPPLYRMRKIERQLEQTFGHGWLNNGSCKDLAFGGLRAAMKLTMPPEVIIFATATNIFRATEKFYELSEDERRRVMEGGHDEHHKAAKQGVLKLSDALTATAQSREQVCVCTQILDDHKQPDGPLEIQCFLQSEFRGRLKMFGDNPPQFDFTKKKRSI